ncbi:MAG: hypothetical protein A2057_00285 [Ignavibacteria bacterium GWA2_35_9]|nr:MAG: hypothetical protein A2057_00285 [Ignavibacteria bacterium GWA2_35_9]OGU45804.1 MAG: hypothetical protein A2000_02600 [Ignavibacteria bacterium GWB2_36_8]OGU51553.1 MAG: hypothetical protein A2080_16220 [Ignavibacteria bacterium GWC2_36_12]OGV07580.1 MAG: hypothetical protein A3J84_10415 [Ignavibacteria bacterium RIFOXYA2_FULL_37_17]
MGDIVFWTLIRLAISIPAVWILRNYIDFQLWWILVPVVLYIVVIHPAFVGYRRFEEKNKSVIESTLCSNCKHFDPTAVLCLKHDKHPTSDYLPCEGFDWELKL